MLLSINTVPVTNGKSIHSAASHGLTFWSSPHNVWENMDVYVITMTDRVITHMASI
uniref:Uncharacterized protein n=1 Tax=Prolemur simus TaxID=1328070 RepID=A0A8C8ZCP2_PROSS